GLILLELCLFRGMDALRSGRPPSRDSGLAPIKVSLPGYAQGRGSMTPSLSGRSRSAGALGLPLVLLGPWPGVISTHAAHRGPTGWRRVTALAGGVTRDRGRSAGPRRPSVWACRSRAPVVAAAACPGSELAGCRAWRCGRLAWIIVAKALSAVLI